MTTMGEESLVKLLLAVARLGEADLFDWWRSRGLAQAGEYVLGSAFPRTWQWSALEGSVLSAARRHEEVLGRPTALHLFSDRLPAMRYAIGWLREQKVAGSHDGLLSSLRAWTREIAPRDMAGWAAVQPPKGELVAEGRRLGVVATQDLQAPDRCENLIRLLAAAYADQPREELRYPYFDVV
jgi:hypothetical protein